MADLLPSPSNEQKKIIKYSLKDKNIVVDSVAGSGKTTTILHVAKINSDKKFVVITYNSKLKKETRDKVEKLGLKNRVDVHSFHSFAVKYYDNSCCRDDGIIKLLKNNSAPRFKFHFDIFVIDEVQDMTKTYFQLIHKAIKDMGTIPQFIIIGDKNQSIYGFNNADNRFIIHAKDIFISNRDWVSLKLNVSFRITHEMASFINNTMLGETRLKAIKYGPIVRYCLINTFATGVNGFTFREIKYYLDKYSPGDIFILAPSIRKKGSKDLGNKKNPIQNLMRDLSFNKYPIYTPDDDDKEINEDLTKNKIVFSTFHQVKGLERKVAIIFCFDQAYFKYYNQHADNSICPNELYVACTRAQEAVSLIHSKQNEYLSFLNLTKPMHVEKPYYNHPDNLIKTKNKTDDYDDGIIAIEVSELLRYLDSITINNCCNEIKYNKLSEPESLICLTKVVDSDSLLEAVSKINHIAIKIWYELHLTNNSYSAILAELFSHDSSLTKINFKQIEGVLFLATKYLCLEKGFYHKTSQIKSYDWITQKNLIKLTNRLDKHIKNGSFEIKCGFHDKSFHMRKPFCYVDCFDSNGIVWEFITNDKIEQEDFLMFSIKAYTFDNDRLFHYDDIKSQFDDIALEKEQLLNALNYCDDKFKEFEIINKLEIIDSIIHKYQNQMFYLITNNINYKLLNIISGEVFQLNYNHNKYEENIKSIIYEKYVKKKDSNNEEFINKMISLRNKCMTNDTVKSSDNFKSNVDQDFDKDDVSGFAFF